MTETIKHINEALNAGISRNYVTNGKQLLHVESDELGIRSTAPLADCASEEIATMLAAAANEWADQCSIIANSSLDDDLKAEMLKASGMELAEPAADYAPPTSKNPPYFEQS